MSKKGRSAERKVSVWALSGDVKKGLSESGDRKKEPELCYHPSPPPSQKNQKHWASRLHSLQIQILRTLSHGRYFTDALHALQRVRRGGMEKWYPQTALRFPQSQYENILEMWEGEGEKREKEMKLSNCNVRSWNSPVYRWLTSHVTFTKGTCPTTCCHAP